MKKITLIMLVAMVPFLTMAQKRAKKDKEKTESNNTSNEVYQFMVMTGMEIAVAGNLGPASDDVRNATERKVKILFDFGGIKELDHFTEVQYRSMAHAVNYVGKIGWRFVSSTIVNVGETRVHYYYMKREK